MPGLKFMRTLWVCEVSGGPFKFTATKPGKTPLGLEEAHRDLRISPAEFDEVAAELGRSLDHFKVPKREKAEVLAAFAAHKKRSLPATSPADCSTLSALFYDLTAGLNAFVVSLNANMWKVRFEGSDPVRSAFDTKSAHRRLSTRSVYEFNIVAIAKKLIAQGAMFKLGGLVGSTKVTHTILSISMLCSTRGRGPSHQTNSRFPKSIRLPDSRFVITLRQTQRTRGMRRVQREQATARCFRKSDDRSFR